MRCGLFGKLSAKRDFIALAVPRKFLEVWEPWMQACMSASRHQLSDAWQNAYLAAPVWRFWLGQDICGTTVTGAVMPSVDGVGRYYPLTLLAPGDLPASIPPPDVDAQNDWFAGVEEFLLSMLDEHKSFDEITQELERFPVPLVQPAETEGTFAFGANGLGSIAADKSFGDAMSELRGVHHATSASASYWWTSGGGDFPPITLCCRGMPDPYSYKLMLTGKPPEIANGTSASLQD